MKRRCVILLVCTCFVAAGTGLLTGLHLHQWHKDHGDTSSHDSDRCPVCQAIVAASHAVVTPGPDLVVAADLSGSCDQPVVAAPSIVDRHRPITPRAPPEHLS